MLGVWCCDLFCFDDEKSRSPTPPRNSESENDTTRALPGRRCYHGSEDGAFRSRFPGGTADSSVIGPLLSLITMRRILVAIGMGVTDPSKNRIVAFSVSMCARPKGWSVERVRVSVSICTPYLFAPAIFACLPACLPPHYTEDSNCECY